MLLRVIVAALWLLGFFDCIQKQRSLGWYVLLLPPAIGPLFYFAFHYGWFGGLKDAMLDETEKMGGRPTLNALKERAHRRDDGVSWEKYGMALLHDNRTEEAFDALERGLDRLGSKLSIDARYNLARLYHERQRLRDAADQFRLVLAFDPDYDFGNARSAFDDILEQLK